MILYGQDKLKKEMEHIVRNICEIETYELEKLIRNIEDEIKKRERLQVSQLEKIFKDTATYTYYYLEPGRSRISIKLVDKLKKLMQNGCYFEHNGEKFVIEYTTEYGSRAGEKFKESITFEVQKIGNIQKI